MIFPQTGTEVEFKDTWDVEKDEWRCQSYYKYYITKTFKYSNHVVYNVINVVFNVNIVPTTIIVVPIK